MRPARSGAALALFLSLVTALPGHAQARRPRVSPLAEPGHWAVDAARRLHAAGLLPRGYDPAAEPPMLSELLAAFDAAAETSPLARAYRARLSDELGGLVLDPDSAASPNGGYALARLRVGLRSDRGGRLLGAGYAGAWSGPVPQRDPGSATAGIELLVRTEGVAAAVRPSVGEDGLELGATHVVAGLGPVVAWAGNGGASFPTTPYGGVAVSQVRLRPGLGVQSVEPLRVPLLGFFRFTTSLTRTAWNQPIGHPWLWTSRLFLSPHERLDLAVNRGIMFGGEGNAGFSLQKLGYMLIGKHTGGFDNQVVSVSARYRPPVGVPLSLNFEWGLEDSAGAWKDVPGILVGLELAQVPGIPEVAVGLTGVRFAPSCCGNSVWYENFAFRGGWADDGFLLGHPLGGHGTELRGYARADLVDARVQLRGSVFGRDRGRENVYAPEREGRSVGLTFGAVGLVDDAWQLELDAAMEAGLANDRWWESRLGTSVRVTF